MSPTISRPANNFPRPPFSCYRIDLSGGSKNRPKSTSKDGYDPAEDRPLLCKICSAAITHTKYSISINGLHRHVFFNPAGITFEVCCYQKAPGCLIEGKPTTVFTWFDGYSWQYAFCTTCLTHLGWWFNSDTHSFFSLIENRLMG